MKKIFLISLPLLFTGCVSFDKSSSNDPKQVTTDKKEWQSALNQFDEYEKVQFSSEEKKVIQWLIKQEKNQLNLLKDLVLINSGTKNIQGLNKLRQRLAKELKLLGFKVKTLPGGEVNTLKCQPEKLKFADHLVATLEGKSGNKLLLSGHMDTVFNKDHPFNNITFKGDFIHGPGVLDMKGGIVVMIYALKALHKFGHLKNKHITVFLNSDEEMGSLGSRPYIEDLSKVHDFGLVFEGTNKNTHIHSRKGLGQIRLVTTGQASHAGNDHKNGVSANKEMAHKVIAIESLTNYKSGITLNVGMMKGGEARNTVPPCAETHIDLRYIENKRAKATVQKVKNIAHKSYTKNKFIKAQTKTKMWSSLHRPAKPKTKRTEKMLSMYLGIETANGRLVSIGLSGGGTDGSIMQAAGLANLDTLGVDGLHSHSPREFAHKSSFVPRIQSAAIYILRLLETNKKGGFK